MYLSDTSYFTILKKIETKVNDPDFSPRFEDSTTIGEKHTISNCGFCNDDFTDLESAMWPADFPQRKDMKYRLEHHKCPFDMRITGDFNFGCFYQCLLFKPSKDMRGLNNKTKIEIMKQLVAKTIKAFEEKYEITGRA